MARISKECHEARVSDDAESLATSELCLDESVMQLWGLTKNDMKVIRRCLDEYGFSSDPIEEPEDED